MNCPKCEVGELYLYKETSSVYIYPLTKDNKIRKQPLSKMEHDTEKDYLECRNCSEMFEYELSDKTGRVLKEYVSERISL